MIRANDVLKPAEKAPRTGFNECPQTGRSQSCATQQFDDTQAFGNVGEVGRAVEIGHPALVSVDRTADEFYSALSLSDADFADIARRLLQRNTDPWLPHSVVTVGFTGPEIGL